MGYVTDPEDGSWLVDPDSTLGKVLTGIRELRDHGETDGAAGLMIAQALGAEEGKPCPVCGRRL